ncbi:MAG: TIGR01440 family protein [Clostridia bacterium]|nr:TIGR01440 family protein [Clostridia bacterium]MBR3593415.1 TIGR01440 family protein [Clostridia bacterium]
MNNLYLETKAAIEELISVAGLKAGQTVIVGCSTSEVLGSKIGTDSSPEAAKEIFRALYEVASEKGIYLAVQCCEHLNRAVVTSRKANPCGDEVNVVPQPKAGGSLASEAFRSLPDAAVYEEIKADAGLDIGLTLIGMHLKKVAVPVRLKNNKIGSAVLSAARTRPKFIGGSRAVYDENKL